MTFLGIDGGGSKTAFLLESDDGKPLARFETGPSNWLSSGPDTARESLAQGVAQLPVAPDMVCGGFAGAGRPEGIEFYRDCLSKLLPHARLVVETDVFITYMGAIGLRPGVLLIAGTGSIALGRRSDGSMVRAGGWGPVFSDEGAGFWIGREAIRHALRANDAAEAPEFATAIAHHLQLRHITDAPAAWKSGALDVRSVASLAAVVSTHFPGEPAKQILEEAAGHLRELVEVVRKRSGLPESCAKSISGSVGTQPLMQQLMGLDFAPPANPPAQGAILWARDRIQSS
ncbi:MAG TPA: BadF/BadG/BcrA/BcrD ATPase family protein [Terriglobia bacterium]|nr:BadF/BadG/BcrA/BcrD ATPase family protein [Terriglobia bacterium]